MEDNYDEDKYEYTFLKEEPITDYDLDTLFIQHDKTEVPPKTRKEFIEKNRIAKANIRDGLMGDAKVAATNWKGHPTPKREAVYKDRKKVKLIPRTSSAYKRLDLDKPAKMITNRLTVPENTPMTPRFQIDEKEWKDGAWRLLPYDSRKDLEYMAAEGGPAVMGIVPAREIAAQKQGTKRKRPGGKRRRKRKTRKKRKSRRKKTRKKRRRKKRRTKKR